MNIKHVIWDYDGTLFDSYPVMAAAFSAALHEYDIAEPAAAIASHMKISAGHAIRYYSEKYQLGCTFQKRYKKISKEMEKNSVKPFDGVTEVCRAIKKRGGKNYLFTHRGESAFYFIEKYGLAPCFEELVTAQNGFARKPSPEAILYLMKKYDFPGNDAIMIGDREIDLLSARNAGVYTCYFTDGSEPPNIAEFSIHDYSELYEVLGI